MGVESFIMIIRSVVLERILNQVWHPEANACSDAFLCQAVTRQPRSSGRWTLGLVLVATLTACGYEHDLFQALPRQTRSSLVIASPNELASAEALAGSYIVTFRAPRGSASRGYAAYLTEAREQYEWIDAKFLTDPRVKDIRYITTVDLGNPRDLSTKTDFVPPPALRLAWGQSQTEELAAAITEVNFTSAEVAAQVLREWEEAGVLWFAEPNYTSTLTDLNQQAVTAANAAKPLLTQGSIAEMLELPRYQESSSIWWHEKIRLVEAFIYASKMPLSTVDSPIIAVLDSGVDILHPDLQDRIWTNTSPGSSGCLDDLHGCDTTVAKKATLGTGTVNPFATTGHGVSCPNSVQGIGEVCQHGTHVAGIIAGRISGQRGGVCPVCRVMPIRIIKEVAGKGVALDSAILNGLKYVTLFRKSGDSGGLVKIVNASFGKATRSRAVAVVVSVLRRPPNEVLIVGAAGNEDTMLRAYPAALSDAIAVAALGPDNGKASYSNFGPWVDIAAPGGDGFENDKILSTVPGGTDGFKQGTSMAAPVVAGVAGLILALDPNRNLNALRTSLVGTADPAIYQPDVRGGFNYNYYFVKPQGEDQRLPLLGAGLLDARAALEAKELNRGRVLAGTRRVNRNCGTVQTHSGSHGLTLTLFWVPLLILVCRRTYQTFTTA